MTRTFSRLIPLALAAVLACAPGCGKGAGAQGTAEEAEPAVPVETYSVGRGQLASVVRITGTLEAGTELTLSAETSAVVRSQLAEEGAKVPAGTLLMKLDDNVLQQQLKGARADVAGAQARLEIAQNVTRPEERQQAESRVNRAQAEYEQAQSDFQRADDLFNSGAISQSERDSAETRMRLAEADLNSAKSALALADTGSRPEDIDAARAGLNRASALVGLYQAQIRQTEVRAPIEGYLVDYIYEVGEMVGMGQPVVRMTSLGNYELSVALPDSQVINLQQGMTIPVEIPALAFRDDPTPPPATEVPGGEGAATGQVVDPPTPSIAATLTYLAPAAESASKLFEVRLTVPDPEGTLRSGVVATALVPVSTDRDVLLVPEAAVISPGTDPHVYVVEAGLARRRTVTTGLIADGVISVLTGLQPSDALIVLGQTTVADGTPVEATSAPAATLPSRLQTGS